MRYAFITWRSHPNDKSLDDEFFSILKLLLNKSARYLVGHEGKDTLSSHFHIILEMPESADKTNLKSKFNSAPWKQFYQSIKNNNCHTQIDPGFIEKALQLKLIEKDSMDHNYIKALGYASKEHIKASKGYSNNYIVDAVDYYWKNTRREKSRKPNNSFIVLNAKNCHTIINDFCQKHSFSLKDKTLPWVLAENSICCEDLSQKKFKRVLATLNLAFQKNNPEIKHLDDFERNIYRNDLTEEITEDWQGSGPSGAEPAFITEMRDQLEAEEKSNAIKKDHIKDLEFKVRELKKDNKELRNLITFS